MTNMKRITVSFPDDIAEAITRLSHQERFKNKSYSEIVRTLVKSGLAKNKTA